MDFLEKDLEQIIYDAMITPEGRNKLSPLIFAKRKPLKVFRQLRIGNYGTADLVVANKYPFSLDGIPSLIIYVIELKKDEVDLETLIQANRYRKGIKRYIKQRSINLDPFIYPVLIGRKVNINSDWVYLFDELINSVYIYTYDYSINGLAFKSEHLGNICLADENFNIKETP